MVSYTRHLSIFLISIRVDSKHYLYYVLGCNLGFVKLYSSMVIKLCQCFHLSPFYRYLKES